MPLRPDLGPKPQLPYANSLLDRAAMLRTDPAALAALEADSRSGFYIVGGELIVTRRNGERGDALCAPWFSLRPPRYRTPPGVCATGASSSSG